MYILMELNHVSVNSVYSVYMKYSCMSFNMFFITIYIYFTSETTILIFSRELFLHLVDLTWNRPIRPVSVKLDLSVLFITLVLNKY